MTGLEFMQAMMDGDVPYPPMAKTVPMRFMIVEDGFMKIEVSAGERHINLFGGVHGGFAATVLDTVAGCAIHTRLEAGVNYATIDLAIKMMRPVPLDVPVIAEGRVINISKSLGVSEGVMKNAEGKILAHATTTCMILRN